MGILRVFSAQAPGLPLAAVQCRHIPVHSVASKIRFPNVYAKAPPRACVVYLLRILSQHVGAAAGRGPLFLPRGPTLTWCERQSPSWPGTGSARRVTMRRACGGCCGRGRCPTRTHADARGHAPVCSCHGDTLLCALVAWEVASGKSPGLSAAPSMGQEGLRECPQKVLCALGTA